MYICIIYTFYQYIYILHIYRVSMYIYIYICCIYYVCICLCICIYTSYIKIYVHTHTLHTKTIEPWDARTWELISMPGGPFVGLEDLLVLWVVLAKKIMVIWSGKTMIQPTTGVLKQQ